MEWQQWFLKSTNDLTELIEWFYRLRVYISRDNETRFWRQYVNHKDKEMDLASYLSS